MKLLSVLLSIGLLGSEAANSNVILYGINGRPAVEVEAIPPANGPTLPEQGVVGRMIYLQFDVTGCSGALSTINTAVQAASMASSGMRPIVLMERSSANSAGCTFEDKIEAVQAAGAVAAIIFDSVQEGPISMVFENEEDLLIPSAFISNEAGMELLSILQDGNQPITILQPGAQLDWRIALSLFEIQSFTSGYFIFFILWLPVCLFKGLSAIRKRKIHSAVFEVVNADESLKATVESKVDPSFLPLNSFQHPASSTCNKLSTFLSLTLCVYVWETFFIEMSLDKDASKNENESITSNATGGEAVHFGVHVMMDSLYIAACLMLIEYFVRSTYHLINDNFCTSSTSANESSSIEEGVGPNITSQNNDSFSDVEKDMKNVPLLSSLASSSPPLASVSSPVSSPVSSEDSYATPYEALPPVPSPYFFKPSAPGKVQTF